MLLKSINFNAEISHYALERLSCMIDKYTYTEFSRNTFHSDALSYWKYCYRSKILSGTTSSQPIMKWALKALCVAIKDSPIF